MRLLNVHTLDFGEFHHEDIPPYIIASHRWGLDELDYKDLRKRRRTNSFGYTKVLKLCEIVRSSHTEVNWLWIDTVCIDKRNSTEVSETINSMFKWYQRAECCLAYLSDVQSPNVYLEKPGKTSWFEVFRRSAWFKRGWTLQELIAPRAVVFLSADWEVLGHKGQIKSLDPRYFHSRHNLTKLICDVSGIPEAVLYDCEERKACGLQEKMSWMTDRSTTRVEDAAYCLLGLFDVFMPPIYGEGDQAHMRLLKEILAKESEHQTKLEEDKMKKRMTEVDMDRELAAEEQASEVARYVSRLVRHGFSRDKAIHRLAGKWQSKWNVSLEKATGDINQFLAVLEYRAAWAREGMDRLMDQGNAKATAVRYLELELQKYGYSPVDAYKAVRVRLKFKPIVDSPAYGPVLGAVREEVPSEKGSVARPGNEATSSPSGANKQSSWMTDSIPVPDIVVTEVSRATIKPMTRQEKSSGAVTQQSPAEEIVGPEAGSQTKIANQDDYTDSQATTISPGGLPLTISNEVKAPNLASFQTLPTLQNSAIDSQASVPNRVEAGLEPGQDDYTEASVNGISASEEEISLEDVGTQDLAIRDKPRASHKHAPDTQITALIHDPITSESGDFAGPAPPEDEPQIAQDIEQAKIDPSITEKEDASGTYEHSISDPGGRQHSAIPPDIEPDQSPTLHLDRNQHITDSIAIIQ